MPGTLYLCLEIPKTVPADSLNALLLTRLHISIALDEMCEMLPLVTVTPKAGSGETLMLIMCLNPLAICNIILT